MKHIEPLVQDPKLLKHAFGCFPSGVVVIAALGGGGPVGMAMSSFTSVSLSPPLVSVCVQETSQTWPRLRSCQRLGVSVLAEGHDEACMRLSSKAGDRFAGVPWESSEEGAVFINEAAAWMDCRLYDELPAGDHKIALLQIMGVMTEIERPPLVFHGSRFRSLAAGVTNVP